MASAFPRKSINIPSVPVPHCSYTHYAPTPTETKQIRDALVLLRSDLAQEDANLRQAAIQREALATYIAEHEALISPVRRTPPEILREIFLQLIPEDSSPNSYPWYSFHAAHIVPLSQVCQQWRQIALATPQLWSCVKFDLTYCTKDGEIELVLAWLGRSGRCPLSFEFQSGNLNPKWQLVLEALVLRSSQWHHAEIFLEWSKAHFLKPIRNHLQQLEFLRVRFDSTPPPLLLDCFEHAPALRRIGSFEDGSVFDTTIDMKLPWGQITYCEAGEVHDLAACLHAMAKMTNLEIFDALLSSDESLSHNKVVVLPRLTSLIIKDWDEWPHSILDNLLLPSLKSLELEVDSDATWGRYDILSFLIRSMCSLKTLSMRGGDITESDHIPEILRHTPDLTNLELFCLNQQASRDILLSLTAPTSVTQSCLVPQLVTLSLDVRAYFNAADFVSMLLSRRIRNRPVVEGHVHGTINCIQSVALHCSDVQLRDIGAREVKQLQDLCEGGMKILL